MPPCVGLLRVADHHILADELSRWLQVAVQHAVAQSAVEFRRARELSIARKVVATLKLECEDAAEAAVKVSSYNPATHAAFVNCCTRSIRQAKVAANVGLCVCSLPVYQVFALTASGSGLPSCRLQVSHRC